VPRRSLHIPPLPRSNGPPPQPSRKSAPLPAGEAEAAPVRETAPGAPAGIPSRLRRHCPDDRPGGPHPASVAPCVRRPSPGEGSSGEEGFPAPESPARRLRPGRRGPGCGGGPVVMCPGAREDRRQDTCGPDLTHAPGGVFPAWDHQRRPTTVGFRPALAGLCSKAVKSNRPGRMEAAHITTTASGGGTLWRRPCSRSLRPGKARRRPSGAASGPFTTVLIYRVLPPPCLG